MDIQLARQLTAVPSAASLREALAVELNAVKARCRLAAKYNNDKKLKELQKQYKLLDGIINYACLLDNIKHNS